MQIRVRFEALGLFVISGRMGIAASHPTPGPIALICLATIDDDRWCGSAHRLYDPSEAVQLRIAAAARKVKKCVVKRIACYSRTLLKSDEVKDEINLKVLRWKNRVLVGRVYFLRLKRA